MNGKIKIEKALLSQPDIERFLSKKMFFINTMKISSEDACKIEKQYHKKSILSLLSAFRFKEAENLYHKVSDYIDEEFYIIETTKFKDKEKIKIDKTKAIKDLSSLSKRLKDIRENQENDLYFCFKRGDLPYPKLEQYIKRMSFTTGDKWGECNVWMYTAAEFAFESWAKCKDLQCIDYNIKNLYHPVDYLVSGVDVDIKTTIGVGRRKLPKYNNSIDCNEILVGVGSNIRELDDANSRHTIHGIYDKSLYHNLDLKLKRFEHNSVFINPCYFSSLDIYFGVNEGVKRINLEEKWDIFSNFLEDRNYLGAMFASMSNKKIISSLIYLLPQHHQDFIPVIYELLIKNKLFLLPHFLADYLLDKIVRKSTIDSAAIEEIIYSVFRPSEVQMIYISNLLKAYNVIDKVRCINHKDESIQEMEVEYYNGSIPTLKLCCSYDQKIKTTFFTYSWKTGETLVYDKNNTCDSPNCGCLTHMHRRKRVGKKSCLKYGKQSFS